MVIRRVHDFCLHVPHKAGCGVWDNCRHITHNIAVHFIIESDLMGPNKMNTLIT